MSEIYWITILGNLSSVCIALIILSVIAIVPLSIWACNIIPDEYSNDSDRKIFRISLRYLKMSTVVFIVAIAGTVLIPSEKQMYAIYGIGGFIDYVKSNDTAKQIPDKVVNALDAWLDKQTEEK